MTLPFVRFLHWTVPAVDTAGWMRYFALRCFYLLPCRAFFHFACYIFNKLVQNEFMPQLLQIVLRISQNVCLKAITTKLVVAITEGDKASLLGSSDNRGLVSRINKEVRLVNPKNSQITQPIKWINELERRFLKQIPVAINTEKGIQSLAVSELQNKMTLRLRLGPVRTAETTKVGEEVEAKSLVQCQRNCRVESWWKPIQGFFKNEGSHHTIQLYCLWYRLKGF